MDRTDGDAWDNAVNEPQEPHEQNELDAANGPRWIGPAGVSFGTLLRTLRENFPERTGRNRPGVVKVRLTALALIECLKAHNYPITSGYFSELERGSALPRDAGSFLKAVTGCLELSDADATLLLYQLGYEAAVARFGHMFAAKMYKALVSMSPTD